MTLWQSFLHSLGLYTPDPWPRAHRAILGAAWAYSQKVTFLAGDRPRVIFRKSALLSNGQWALVSPTGKVSVGWYVPDSQTVVLVVGRDGTNLHLEAAARHEFAHHLLWTKRGTMEHEPEFRQFFRGWNQ